MTERVRYWPPRAMAEPDAAYYVSLSISSFRTEVGAGRAPAPFQLTRGRKAWLREDLDAYLNRLAGREPASDPSQDWVKCFEQDVTETTGKRSTHGSLRRHRKSSP